ncbi:hypothetical protein ACP4OV_008063 [Aristida adscensionis]
MEQKQCALLGLVAALLLAGRGHAVRLLHDDGREFAFGAKAAAVAGNAETTEPLDQALGDYENEISQVEFEPELGASYAVAGAPGPAPEPMAAARDDAAGSRSMKWWLPPSTMPSFPLFPNPAGMPGIPGIPLPAMPFHPIGAWGAPAPPGQAQPAPPAAASSAAGANPVDPNTNQMIN